MRQPGPTISDRLDAEVHRAKNMGEPEFGCANAPGVCDLPRGVDHAELDVAEFIREFARRAKIA